MSVGDHLQIEESSALLDQARERWPEWSRQCPALRVVAAFDELRAWLPTVDRETSDVVLSELARLAATDGGDDEAAAAALAKALLPGVCRLAGQLVCRAADLARRMGGEAQASELIDQMVAAQLWIEVRTFPWRRRRNVAANVVVSTRIAVLRELGEPSALDWHDRSWAEASTIDEVAGLEEGLLNVAAAAAVEADSCTVVPAQAYGSGVAGADERESCEELLDLLTWACAQDVISVADRRVLLCLVEEAARVETRNLRRGYGGLLNRTGLIRVAPRLGMSPRTVQRHATRSVKALAQAADAGVFCDV